MTEPFPPAAGLAMSGPHWQDVTETLLARWPVQKWDRDQLAAYIAEIQHDGLTPVLALDGLRASSSGFVPSAGELRELARCARPVTIADIQAAQTRRELTAQTSNHHLEKEPST